MFGPLAPGFKVTKDRLTTLSTIGYFRYNVLSSQELESVPKAPFTVDVRDLARAHILAVTAPSSAVLKKKKRLIVATTNWSWVDAITYLAETRPELEGRLSGITHYKAPTAAVLDSSLTEEVLGLKEYIDWRRTIDDMVNSILEVEKS